FCTNIYGCFVVRYSDEMLSINVEGWKGCRQGSISYTPSIHFLESFHPFPHPFKFPETCAFRVRGNEFIENNNPDDTFLTFATKSNHSITQSLSQSQINGVHSAAFLVLCCSL